MKSGNLKQCGLTCQRQLHPPGNAESLTYMVEIDRVVLDAQARKAAKNKSRQSQDGALTVTITRAGENRL